MTPQQEIVDKISHIALPIVQELSLELVDVELAPAGRRWLLRIYIDREGGVTISDCEQVSRELDRLLDVEDFIDHPYVLEVSSPGLTRPLKKARDFERYRGRKAKIVTRSMIGGKNEFKGEIVEVAGDDVDVRTEGDIVHRIPLNEIKKANLEFEL
jgi:ribosome maturation factor RimP